MAVITALKRVFVVDGTRIDDPNPSWTIDEVRKFLMAEYPELTNADVEGPTYEEDCAVYEFSGKIGGKG